jgi:hypothetical protein
LHAQQEIRRFLIMPNMEDLNSQHHRAGDAAVPNALALHAQDLQRQQRGQLADDSDTIDPLALLERNARGVTAAASLGLHTAAGALFEQANFRDLTRLQLANPTAWSTLESSALNTVRSQLSARGPAALMEEQHVLQGIGMRGALKGAIGAGIGLVGTMAVDAMFFPDTPRTYSKYTDMAALPLIGLAPMNPYLKAASMIGVHTVGRLLDQLEDDGRIKSLSGY